MFNVKLLVLRFFDVVPDEKEKARLDIHAAIRDACSQGDTNSVQQLISSLSDDAELIVNMAPSGANTLLFTYISNRSNRSSV